MNPSYISECCHAPIKDCHECGDAVCTTCENHCDILDMDDPENLTPSELLQLKEQNQNDRDHRLAYEAGLGVK